MVLSLVLAAALHAAPAPAPAFAADTLTGIWQVRGDVMGNPLKETCTLRQSGTVLSGSCTNEEGGPYAVTGEAKDGKFTFKHGGDYQGTALTIVYSGTLASPKAFKGTIEVQPFGAAGTFAAAPAPAKP